MTTKSGEKLLYEELTYPIRGACFSVWKEFGGAFKEKVVDRALTEELRSKGLRIENQKVINICYKGKKIASYIPDKIINNAILLEIKCKPFLTKEDERQFWYYLKGSNYRVGLLINFGSKKLEIKRRIYDKARSKSIRVNPRVNPRLSASTNKGFTLIEMLVAVTVFALIIGSATGLFVSAVRAQAKALAVQKLIDETSYVMEKMSRSIRMAKKDLGGLCTFGCPGGTLCNYSNPWGDFSIAFINSQSSCAGFYLKDITDTLLRQSPPGGDPPLTSPDFEVASIVFDLSGETQADNLQPRVTISMTLRKAGATKPEIKIQTTISQRDLDVQK